MSLISDPMLIEDTEFMKSMKEFGILKRKIARNQFFRLIHKWNTTPNPLLKSYYKDMLRKLIQHEKAREYLTMKSDN